MSWTPKKRRMALVIVPTALIAAAVLGVSFVKVARAAFQSTPYSQSPLTPCVMGQPFMVTIQNPLYNSSSMVMYAQVFNSVGKPVGYWAPLPNNTTTTGQWFNVVGSANMITVLLDTSTLLSAPPGGSGPGSPAGSPTAPGKSMPAVQHPEIGPVITSGAIICITTNVTGDACPTNPIKINITNVTPCQPCP